MKNKNDLTGRYTTWKEFCYITLLQTAKTTFSDKRYIHSPIKAFQLKLDLSCSNSNNQRPTQTCEETGIYVAIVKYTYQFN